MDRFQILRGEVPPPLPPGVGEIPGDSLLMEYCINDMQLTAEMIYMMNRMKSALGLAAVCQSLADFDLLPPGAKGTSSGDEVSV